MLKPAAGAAALGAPLPSDSDATALLATYAAQQPSLSIVKASLGQPVWHIPPVVRTCRRRLPAWHAA